jgi:hypothetical protein
VRVITLNSNLVELQLALRQFVPVRGIGPAIWLVGVSHLGDSNYYAAIQAKLDAQSLVLFEGVSARPGAGDEQGRRALETQPPDSARRNSPDRSSLQSSLATALGLCFQLQAIDYDRPNFRNCDLSVNELREIIAEQPPDSNGPGAGPGFESLLQMMEGSSFFDSVLQFSFRFLSNNPKLQALARLALIEAIGEIQGDPSQLKGLDKGMRQLFELLVARRNQKVLHDLKVEIRNVGPRGSLAVFYGTAHMPDFERRLRTELGYRPGAEVWLSAFSVDLKKSGVSEAERGFIHSVLSQELEQLKSPKAEGPTGVKP